MMWYRCRTTGVRRRTVVRPFVNRSPVYSQWLTETQNQTETGTHEPMRWGDKRRAEECSHSLWALWETRCIRSTVHPPQRWFREEPSRRPGRWQRWRRTRFQRSTTRSMRFHSCEPSAVLWPFVCVRELHNITTRQTHSTCRRKMV